MKAQTSSNRLPRRPMLGAEQVKDKEQAKPQQVLKEPPSSSGSQTLDPVQP